MESSSERVRPIIIYPVYFKKVSRRLGRKVPLKYAGNFSLSEIEKAIRSLGYRVEIEKDKKHPARWWEEEGRLVVFTSEKKNKFLLKTAQKLNNF